MLREHACVSVELTPAHAPAVHRGVLTERRWVPVRSQVLLNAQASHAP